MTKTKGQPLGSNECNSCDKKIKTINDLKTQKKIEGTRRISCKYCDEVFNQNHELEKHLAKHKNKEFKCKLC